MLGEGCPLPCHSLAVHFLPISNKSIPTYAFSRHLKRLQSTLERNERISSFENPSPKVSAFWERIFVFPIHKYRQAVLELRSVCVSGTAQNQDGIVHLKAERVEALTISAAQMSSHNFH
jgi:hypothetical protein